MERKHFSKNWAVLIGLFNQFGLIISYVIL